MYSLEGNFALRESRMRKLILMLGVPVDDLTMGEALDRLEEFIRIGRLTGRSHQVATVNADFVVKAMHDPELRHLLQEADMATADGMPLVWGARLLGVSLEGRVAGSDLVPALVQRAAEKGYSVYFLGAAPGVADKAVEVLSERHPDLIVAGVQSPPYSSVLEMDPSILDDIRAARPDILLVAFGNPKQEKWIGMYSRRLSVPVMIGVGATLDFIAGSKARAPMWMQRAGLEWLHRLVQEPGRMWKRYVVDFAVFGAFFARQWWLMRRGGDPPASSPGSESMMMSDTAVVNARGRLTIDNYQPFMREVQQALHETPRVLVNLSEVEFLDSSAIGMLVGLAKQARDAGGDLALVAAPRTIYHTFRLLRLETFFIFYDDMETAMSASTGQTQTTFRFENAGTAVTDWQVIATPRRLDATTAAELEESWSDLAAATPRIVLDFSETVLLTSAGLALLARLNRQVTESGGEIRAANCSKDVLRVIEMVRFDKVLHLYPDLATALR